jgi:hypothetical protein
LGFFFFAGATAQAQLPCRQGLVLALDVSGSIDHKEYRQQLDGVSKALLSPRVQNLVLAMPSAPISIYIYEWSSEGYQSEILPWTQIDTAATLETVAGIVANVPRRRAQYTTAIGASMLHGLSVLQTGPSCWQYTIDISGDGKNNDGPIPINIRDMRAMEGVTINALVIGRDSTDGLTVPETEISELVSYFGRNVIRGQAAFIETSLGYKSYASAMTRKLLRELSGMMMSAR